MVIPSSRATPVRHHQKKGANVFHAVTWDKSGGVKDSGYVWADDKRWSIDEPEKPRSILAFIIYRHWVKGQALDLRDASLSVHLRGDKLALHGAKCYFWVLGHGRTTRWHLKAHPFEVPESKWSDRQTAILKLDAKQWHRSWSWNPKAPGRLEEVLSNCESYGFSFVGSSEKVTGKLAMDELTITLPTKR